MAPKASAHWAARMPDRPGAGDQHAVARADADALRHAQMPTESGSISAPSSSESESGSANAKSSWIGTNSANAPSIGGVAKKTTSTQRL